MSALHEISVVSLYCGTKEFDKNQLQQGAVVATTCMDIHQQEPTWRLNAHKTTQRAAWAHVDFRYKKKKGQPLSGLKGL